MEVGMAGVPSILLWQLVASRNGTPWQTRDMISNFTRSGEPNLIPLWVVREVFENSLQMFEAERLSYNKGV